MTTSSEPAHRFSHQAMGTFFEIAVAGEDETYAGQAAQAVFHEIDRIESLFNRFNPASEISRMSRLKPGESLIIGIETFECLTIADRARQETQGAFDVNIRALAKYQSPDMPGAPGNLVTCSEFSENPRMPTNLLSLNKGSELASSPLKLIRTGSGFEALPTAQKDAPQRSLDLDLGGIGKGFALDKALALLADWSIENALIHAGTSTAVAIGSAPHDLDTKSSGAQRLISEKKDMSPSPWGWPVGVGGGWPCPDAPRSIFLSGRALSGSGTEVKGSHILDPRTGNPAKGHIAAWASHPSAAIADALSTAFMVMSTEEVETYCLRHSDVWALVVKDYGDCKSFGKIQGHMPNRV
jgi:thiamine biosynthesis lipoprotein